MNYEELQEAKQLFLDLLHEFHKNWDPIKIAEYINVNKIENSESQDV